MSTTCQNVLVKSLKFFRLMSQNYEKLEKKFKKLSSIFSPVTNNAVLTSLQNFRRWNSNCFLPKDRKCWKNKVLKEKLSPQHFSGHIECSIDKLMENFLLRVWTFHAQIQKIAWNCISSSENIFPLSISSDQEYRSFGYDAAIFFPLISQHFLAESMKIVK